MAELKDTRHRCRFCGVTTWEKDYAKFMKDHDRADGKPCKAAARGYVKLTPVQLMALQRLASFEGDLRHAVRSALRDTGSLAFRKGFNVSRVCGHLHKFVEQVPDPKRERYIYKLSAFGLETIAANEKNAQAKKERDVYCTSYCNFGHDMQTGRPVDHECRTLPTAALRAEREGNVEEALRIINAEARCNHPLNQLKPPPEGTTGSVCGVCGEALRVSVPPHAPRPTSYAMEVIADGSGKWCGNEIRLATKEEAEAYARHKAMTWTLVRETRVVESTDPVNYCWDPEKGLVNP